MQTLYCRQHTATYQIKNLTTQTSREGSNTTNHEFTVQVFVVMYKFKTCFR